MQVHPRSSFVARDGSAGNNLRVVVADKVADSKMTKTGHGLSVGAALSDGATTDHEVTVVIDANTVGIKHGAAMVLYLVTDLHNLHSQIQIGTLFQLDLLD